MRQLVTKNKLFILGGIFIIAVIIIFFPSLRTDGWAQTESDAQKNLAQNKNQSADATASTDVTKAIPLEQVQTLDEAEFQNWVRQEAKGIDLTTNNTEEKEIEMRSLAQTLTAAQNRKLAQISAYTQADVNSRILSVYLLTLNPVGENQNFLLDFALKALPDLGPITPHSVAEVKHTQELALRMMAIDELAQQARTDTEAADKLRQISEQAESAEIRSYAQRKILELG